MDYYEIAARQITQQILPAGFPATTVWAYGEASTPSTFHYPAYTIEAQYGRPGMLLVFLQLCVCVRVCACTL